MLAVHVGTNDIDKKGGAEVFSLLKDFVRKVKTTNSGMRIIMSELTPRRDNRDTEVSICNTLLQSLNEEYDNISIACHSNLRVDDWKFHDDDKHLSKVSIAKFASNIKIAFRKAFNVSSRKWKFCKGRYVRYGGKKKPYINNGNSKFESDFMNSLASLLHNYTNKHTTNNRTNYN